jgi:uncharacterized protein (TIGR02611 family)
MTDPPEAQSPFRRKATVAVAGTATVALGVVLLPLPGPGTVIILGGLTILSREFPSAARALRRLRGFIDSRARRDRDPDEPQR